MATTTKEKEKDKNTTVMYGESTVWTNDMSEEERSSGMKDQIDTSADDVNLGDQAGVDSYTESADLSDAEGNRVFYGESSVWTDDMNEDERSSGMKDQIDTSADDVNLSNQAGVDSYTESADLADAEGNRVFYGESSVWTDDMSEDERSSGMKDQISTSADDVQLGNKTGYAKDKSGK